MTEWFLCDDGETLNMKAIAEKMGVSEYEAGITISKFLIAKHHFTGTPTTIRLTVIKSN